MQSFTFPSADGVHEIAALYGKSAAAKGVLVFHHGMRDHKNRYLHLAETAIRRQYDVLLYDAVCHGDSILDPRERGSSRHAPFRQVLLSDCRQALHIASNKSNGLPVFLAGHSLGSFVVRNIITESPLHLHGAILLSTGHAPRMLIRLARLAAEASAVLTGAHRRNKATVYFIMWLINTPFAPIQTHAEWISRDKHAVLDFTFDPKSTFTYTNYAFRGIYDLIIRSENFSAYGPTSHQLPIFFQSGTDDLIGAFGHTIPWLVKRAEKNGFRFIESRLYPNARHDLLHETNHKEVIRDLFDWCDAQLIFKRTSAQTL